MQNMKRNYVYFLSIYEQKHCQQRTSSFCNVLFINLYAAPYNVALSFATLK